MRNSSKILAEFYYQFGTMIQAGVSVQKALATLKGSAPKPLRATLAAVAEAVDRGEPFHQAIAAYPKLFTAIDRQTLAVSEQSGAFDVGLLALGQYHDARAKARGRIKSAMLFPVTLLTAAVFISHFPALLLGMLGQSTYSVANYLFDTVGFLLLVVVIGGLGWRWINRLLQTPGLNVRADRVLRAIPLFGRLRFDYALSQWISSIRLMLNAGFAIFEALDYASRTTTSPLIADAYQQARPLIHGQTAVSAALQSTGVFPDQVIQFWATGEQSGRLDEMLDRLAKQAEERWRESLDHLTAWLPRIAYGLVSLYIIFQIARLLAPVASFYQELLQ